MNYQFELKEFSLTKTGADGGHTYIKSEVLFKNSLRNITIILKNKYDEQKLYDLEIIRVKGEIMEDDKKNPLILSDAELLS